MYNYFKSILKLPFALKWFLITECFYGLSIGIWSVNLNFHLQSRGMSAVAIGSLLTITTLASAILSVISGALSDKIGFYPAMVFGCIIKGIGMVMVAVSTGYIGFVLSLILMSLGDAMVLSCEFPFLFSITEEEDRPLAYSLLIAVFMLAMVLGNALGGTLSQIKLLPKSPYLMPLLISGILFVVLGVGRSILPRNKVQSINKKRRFYHLFGESKIRWFLLYSLIAGLAFNLVMSMMNILLKSRFGMSDSEVGIAYSCVTFVGFISGFLSPMIVKRMGNAKAVLVAMLTYSIVVALMGFSSLVFFFIFWLVYTFCRMIVMPAIDSPMLSCISSEEQGSYSGLKIFSMNIGSGIGASVAGYLFNLNAYTLLMIVAAFFILMQLSIYWFKCRRCMEEAE